MIVLALLAAVLLIAGGCGDESGSGEPGPADTSLAAKEFRSTFGEPPDRCQAGYGVWETGLDFEEHDVTYCFSGKMFAGRPFNTGCYITETGEDVTVAYREINGTNYC